MKLDTYMKENGIKNRAAAAALEISESQMSRLRTGQCKPEYSTLEKIVDWSGGEVRGDDFLAEKVGDGNGRKRGVAKTKTVRATRRRAKAPSKPRPAAGA